MIYSKKGMFVRIIYLIVSAMFFVASLGGLLFRNKKVILCYHGIDDCDAKKFRRQVRKISGRVIPLLGHAGKNKKNLFLQPRVVVTFDDVFQNLNKNVLPVIEEFKTPIAIYVVTNCMGDVPIWLKGSQHKDAKKLLMTIDQIQELARNPLVLTGTHSSNHHRMSTLNKEKMAEEVSESKKYLEKIIGRNVESIAFPHGDYNDDLLLCCAELGLTSLLTLDEKLTPIAKNNGVLGRFSMEPSVWMIEFYLTVSGSYAWLFYFRKVIRLIKNKN